MFKTYNINIESIDPIIAPVHLKESYPLNKELENKIVQWRNEVSDIISGRNNRKLVVVGPCSIHDPNAAIEYANWLSVQRNLYKDKLFIVMRVYFEKPRTTIGWKGLINDPYLNETYKINDGIKLARKLLLKINNLGVPVGCEFLDVFTPQYYSDLVTWGAIGARTTESQLHRQLASGLSMPIGFKNGTGGSVDIAIDAVISANHKHTFIGIDEDGRGSIVMTKGNDNSHIILRGGKTSPNYNSEHIQKIKKSINNKNIKKKIIIDCSHANSCKIHTNQINVLQDIANQILFGEDIICGVMIESNLVEGNQKLENINNLKYGQSITDACVNLQTTTEMFNILYSLEIISNKKQKLSL